MKVLLFADEYDYSYFTFIYNEVKKLQEAGVEVYVVCDRVGKLREADTNYSCIPHKQNALLRRIYLQAYKRKMHYLLSLFSYYRKRKRIIKEFKPDIIHTHFGDTAVRLYFTLEKSLRKIPFVVTFHGFDASSFLNNRQYADRLKVLVKKANFYALYASRSLLNNLLAKNIAINREKAYLLYCGVHTEAFKRTNYHNNDVRVFLQISGFFEKKGHVYTLQAFKKFLELQPGIAKLVIGGDGPLKQDIMAKATALGLDNVVEFKGWVSRENAVNLMNEADYFVHHSITAVNGDLESCPNAIMEAMAMELPILATIHSGIPEFVEDGKNGYLVEEKDVDAYAQRMEDILSWTYVPANREKIKKGFSIEIHTANLINIYNKITGNLS